MQTTAEPIQAFAPQSAGSAHPQHAVHEKLSQKPHKYGVIGFGVALTGGLLYVAAQLIGDLQRAPAGSVLPYILLGVALLIALGFEFVNGFHDTANAVATV